MKVTTVLVVAFVLVLCWAEAKNPVTLEDEERGSFDYFMKLHKKSYKDAKEIDFRFKTFQKNLRMIITHNNLPRLNYVLGLNQFADMTNDEYQKQVIMQHPLHFPRPLTSSGHSFVPPVSLDWRTAKPAVVAPVRNIGACGSAVVVAIVDSVSGEYSVATKNEVYVFNTSFVTDCDGGACTAQTAGLVWNFIEANGLWWFYDQCPQGPGVGICISGHNCTSPGNEADLQVTVSNVGPVSVLVDASQTSFQLYASGVYSDPKCATNKPNHALQVVGYGTTNGQDYWIARNSWGTSWGMNGDILIARNKGNTCGIASNACFAAKPKNCVC